MNFDLELQKQVQEIFDDLSVNYHRFLSESDETIVSGTTNDIDWTINRDTGICAVQIPAIGPDLLPVEEANPFRPADYLLSTFLLKTLGGLISKGLHIAMVNLLDGSTQYLVQLEGDAPKEFLLTQEEATKMTLEPTSKESIDLLETIVKDLNITMEDVKEAEELNALRAIIGDY